MVLRVVISEFYPIQQLFYLLVRLLVSQHKEPLNFNHPTCRIYIIFRQHRTRQIKMKVCEVIKLLEADGWYLVTTKGSQRQYKHPAKSGRVTIAGHNGDDLAPGTLISIAKQAQLKMES